MSYVFIKQDPLVLSAHLSCVSALFPYLSQTPELIPEVLKKVSEEAPNQDSGNSGLTCFFHNCLFQCIL